MALPVNIDDLINHRKVECARIEYKEGWNPERVLHTLCAFANDFDNWGGGYVILGVAEKDGKPVFPVKGLPTASVDRIQKELLGVCHLIEPLYLPVVEPVEYQGKTLLVVWAPGGCERQKVALGEKKVALGEKKVALVPFEDRIAALKLTKPTEANILRMYSLFGLDRSFSRLQVINEMPMKRAAAWKFLAKLHALGLTEPVIGDGRGHYKFRA